MLTKTARSVLSSLRDLTDGSDVPFGKLLGTTTICRSDDLSRAWDYSACRDEIDGVLGLLARDGAIEPVDTGLFRLTHVGIHYKELRRMERAAHWKDRIAGFLCGVATTVVAALLVHLITA